MTLLLLAALQQAHPPELTVSLDRDEVAVGEEVVLTVRTRSSSALPIDLRLGATNGFVVVSRTEGTSVNPDAAVSRTKTIQLRLRAIRAGQWTFVSGSSGVNCNGTISVTASSGFMTITPAPSGDLLTVQMSGCSFSFFLDGDTAIADPPDQRCAVWAIPNIPVWTLRMQADGTLEEKLGGRIWLNGEACMLSGKSTLMRK